MKTLVHLTLITYLLVRTTLVIISLHFNILSILVILLLSNHGYRDQCQIIPVFSIHKLSECVTVIFSLVTFDEIICDYGIIDRRENKYQDGWKWIWRFLVKTEVIWRTRIGVIFGPRQIVVLFGITEFGEVLPGMMISPIHVFLIINLGWITLFK